MTDARTKHAGRGSLTACRITKRLIISLLGPLAIGTLFSLSTHAVVDNWDVDGANGILHVSGTLTESACRLDMRSQRQDIALGGVGTGQVSQAGERGTPVAFELMLRDCIRGPARNLDIRTGSLTWSKGQPAVKVNFNAVRDDSNPRLIKAQGVSGLALRLEDAYGQQVPLGNEGQPMLLLPGQNTLQFRVMPERTPAELVPGNYHAVIDFHLSYD